MSDDLTRAKWNYKSIMSGLVLFSGNFVGGWLVISGKITWSDYGATIGVMNGAVLGWISKDSVNTP